MITIGSHEMCTLCIFYTHVHEYAAILHMPKYVCTGYQFTCMIDILYA